MNKTHDTARPRAYAEPEPNTLRLSRIIGPHDQWTEPRFDERSVRWFDRTGRAMVCVAVVDDEPDIVDIVDQLLAEQGWDVLKCQDGRAAAAVIQQEQPDVILLELWLGTINTGWAVLRELQQDPRTSTIPTIVYSGAVDQLHAMKGWLEERGIAVLIKPFDIDDFERTVQAAVARKNPTSACFQPGAIAL